MNKISNYITIILSIVIILLLLRLCERPRVVYKSEIPNVITITDTLIKQLHDTLTITRIRYKSKVDTIYKIAPSICDTFIKVIVEECDKLDSANNVLINTYSVQVNNYVKLVDAKNDTINKLKRKSKYNLFKGGAIGFGIGYLTGKII
jgi:hypothetical protein